MSEVVLEKNSKLPQGWVVCKLEDVAMAINSGFASGVHNKSEKGIPHIRPMNIDGSGDIDLSIVKYVEDNFKDKLKKNDVLFNNTNSPKWLGKTALIKKNTNWGYSNHMTRIRFDTSKVESSWFALFLHKLFLDGYYQQIAKNHVNQSSVNSTTLATKVSIIVAPRNEQKRIVTKIEELFSNIDSAKQSLGYVKLQLKQYKSSLLKFAFEGKLTEDWRELNNDRIESAENLLIKILNEQNLRPENNLNVEQELPQLPRSWIWSSIKTICKNYDHQRIPISAKKRKQIQGKIPYYGASGIIDYVEKPIFSGKYFLIGEDGGNLISRSTPLGFIVKGDFWVNNHAHILSTYGNIPLEFLVYYIASISLKPWISGTAQPKLNQENLKKIPVPLPPLEEQEQIITKIEQSFSLIENTNKIVNYTLENLQTMKISLLKQAFEGKLVPQDPNDEPAEILLQKIKHENEQLIQKQKVSKVNQNVK